MSVQVLGRDAEVGVAGAAAHDPDERRRLVAGIAVARQRIIAARGVLASSHDAELRCVQAAQRVLAEERHETARVVANIAADADVEVARILGGSGPAPLAADRGAPSETHSEADLSWLRGEFARLNAKAELLERNAAQAADAPAALANRAQVALLEGMLSGAVEVARAGHRRARDAALREAEERLAAAREEAEQRRYRSAAAPERFEQEPDWAPAPSTELVLRPVPDDHVDAAAGPAVWRPEPGPALARTKPMVLDVVLPLIAVAIVLLVVLSWIG